MKLSRNIVGLHEHNQYTTDRQTQIHIMLDKRHMHTLTHKRQTYAHTHKQHIQTTHTHARAHMTLYTQTMYTHAYSIYTHCAHTRCKHTYTCKHTHTHREETYTHVRTYVHTENRQHDIVNRLVGPHLQYIKLRELSSSMDSTTSMNKLSHAHLQVGAN